MLDQNLKEAAAKCAEDLAEKLHNGKIEMSHDNLGQNCIVARVSETIPTMPTDYDAQQEVLAEIHDVFYRHLRNLSGHCCCPKKRGVLLADGILTIIVPGCCGHCAS